MLVSTLTFLLSTFAVYETFVYYRKQIHDLQGIKPYEQAILFMQNSLAQVTDLDQHHFQPCRNCGFPLNIVKDVSYCKKSDLYKLLHPKTVLEDLNVFRDYAGIDLARKLMQEDMYDSLPRFNQVNVQNLTMFSNLPLTTTILYPYAKNYFRTHTLGYAGGCLFTKYFHVPGQEEISLKSNQSTHFHNYITSLIKQGKPEKCIDDAKYFKKTYRLWDRNECQEIFKLFDKPDYQDNLRRKGISYIFKTNRHLGNGILLLDFTNERTIRKWYNNGTDCGKNRSDVIIQEYVTNPYLFKGHKLEFRAYFTIASTSPPILYAYKVALIKQCALQFNLRSFQKEGHVCNTAVTKKHKDGTKDEDDDLYIDWNLEELQELLLSEKRINSTTWLQDFLLPQIYRKVTHLYLSVQNLLFSDSRVGEFFGVDFILDDNFRLWILECNRNPNFLAVTQGRKDKFGKLIPDMLDLQWRLVKSKYKRLKQFVENNLQVFSQPIDNSKRSELINLFMELQKDKMDEEDVLQESSLLELVYIGDKRLGKHQSKFIQEECL